MRCLAVRLCVVIFVSLFFNSSILSQCLNITPSTPYVESFETSNGNWTTGGTSSDWSWGHPAKSTINASATGQNCWITGGLNSNDYNAGQRSFLVSPCFNFTNIPYPYIEFKIFWESEYKYDGSAFQYSIDNGANWQNVGGVSEPANCLNTNWFNTTSVNNLTGLGPSKEGWSGTIKPSSGSCNGGNGSTKWITASHTLGSLAGKANVKFRFTFGAGTTCNTYDGIAIDDITIGNAPPNSVDFSTSCVTGNQLSFINLSTPCLAPFSWNFGDPPSGVSNTATSYNAAHTFSSAGAYTITLTATGGTGPAVSVTKTIYVTEVQARVVKNISCSNAADGELAAVATADPGVSGIAYSWSTTPATNAASVTGLAGGTYIVSVSAANACTAYDTITLVAPPALTHRVVTANATCGKSNGTISISEGGGTGPYAYTWLPNVSTGSTGINLSPANYIITITDSKGCTDSLHAAIINEPGIAITLASKTNVSCYGGNSGGASVNATTGSAPYTFAWTSGSSIYTGNPLVNVPAGTYQVVVKDNTGCISAPLAVVISQPLQPLRHVVTVNDISCTNSSGNASIMESGGTAPYSYSWAPSGGSLATATNLTAGNYVVTIIDAQNCIDTLHVQILNTITASATISATANVTCPGGSDGSATVVAGGIAPFTFVWSPAGGNVATANSLAAGNYTVTVTDGTGCAVKASVQIIEPSAIMPSISVKNTTCGIDNGEASILATTGGTAPYTYKWITLNSSMQHISNLKAGNYALSTKDSKACQQISDIYIKPSLPLKITLGNGNDTIICPGNKLVLFPGDFAAYKWQDNSTDSFYVVGQQGTYTVSVTDSVGCTATASLHVKVECRNIVFPNAFTPNGDKHNDLFGPLGTLSAISDYSLKVFNRWGQIVFTSANPYIKWNGKVNGAAAADNGVYVWMAEYSFDRRPKVSVKGTVMVVR